MVVDSYKIILSPMLTPDDNVVIAPAWSITVERNIRYSVSIFAKNCVGKSTGANISFTISKYNYATVV